MSEMKYVVLRSGMFEYPIIFPDKLSHQEVAVALRPHVPGWNDPDGSVRIVSAGFLTDWNVRLDPERISETLGKGPRPEDQELINNYMYGHGITGD